MPQERIQKILAQAGVASRRACEDLIRQGRVTVNGQPVAIGDQADPALDTIRVDGEVVYLQEAPRVYILLNKPVGVVSTTSAQRQESRPTVRDLVPVAERVYPVGRLDADSEGLILLTNDGELAQRLTHPRYGHQKTYQVLVLGRPAREKLDQWRAGVVLDDGPTGACHIQVLGMEGGNTWLEITMGEGRKRQIRRTAAALHLHIERLIRTRIGPLHLETLQPGEWRSLTTTEVNTLLRGAAERKARPRGAEVYHSAPRRPGPARGRTGGKARPGHSAEPPGGPAREAGRKPAPRRRPPEETLEDWGTRPARSTGDRPPSPRKPARPSASEQTSSERPPGGRPPARRKPARGPSGDRPPARRKPAPGGKRPAAGKGGQRPSAPRRERKPRDEQR